MSVTSEINRIKANIAAAYTAISNKGGTLPSTRNSANLAAAIASITAGGQNSVMYDGGAAGTYWGFSDKLNQSYFANKSGYVGVHSTTLGTKAYAYLLDTADLSGVSQIRVTGYALVYDSRYPQKIEISTSIGGTAAASLSLNQSSGSWGSATSPVTSVLDVSSLTGTRYYIHLSNTRTVGGSAQWGFYVKKIELVP